MLPAEELLCLWEVPMMKNQTICLGRRVLEILSHAKEDRTSTKSCEHQQLSMVSVLSVQAECEVVQCQFSSL